MHVMM